MLLQDTLYIEAHFIRKLVFSRCLKVSPMLNLLLTFCNHQRIFLQAIIIFVSWKFFLTLNDRNPLPIHCLVPPGVPGKGGEASDGEYDILTDIKKNIALHTDFT